MRYLLLVFLVSLALLNAGAYHERITRPPQKIYVPCPKSVRYPMKVFQPSEISDYASSSQIRSETTS